MRRVHSRNISAGRQKIKVKLATFHTISCFSPFEFDAHEQSGCCHRFRTGINVKVKPYCPKADQEKDIIQSFLAPISTHKDSQNCIITFGHSQVYLRLPSVPHWTPNIPHGLFQHLGTPQFHSQQNHPITLLLPKRSRFRHSIQDKAGRTETEYS